MRAGQLRDQIDIQRAVARGGDDFGPATVWRTFTTVWANVTAEPAEDVSGRIANYTIRTRYSDGVLPEQRIVYRDKVLNVIGAIDPDGRRRELVITAAEYKGVSK